MKQIKGLLIVLIAFICSCNGQKTNCNCPDFNAENFGIRIDSSCICKYPAYNASKEWLCNVSSKLHELSGHIYINHLFWGINDSGNPEILYAFNESGELVDSTRLIETKNKDWEELTTDGKYIYVANTGNNKGSREKLEVLRFLMTELGKDSVIPQSIQYTFEDQTDFEKKKDNHNFDCEAIIVFNDTVHLYTKNWLDLKTNHYVFPAIPGKCIAKKTENFDVHFLVTGAAFNAEQKLLSLVGYDKEGNVGLWVFKHSYHANLNAKFAFYIDLGVGSENGQVESVSWRDSGYLYIGNEKFMDVSQGVGGLSLQPYLYDLPYTIINQNLIEDITTFPMPKYRTIQAEVICKKTFVAELMLMDAKGKIIYTQTEKIFQHGYNQIKMSADEIAPGGYVLYIIPTQGEKPTRLRFFVNP